MELIRGWHNLRPCHHGCVASIGSFDGVHLGHRAVIEQLAAIARRGELPATLVTFEPQPQEFFADARAPARLTRLREKLELFAAMPIDRVLVLRFDAQLSGLRAGAFIERILVQGLGVRSLVVGDDFRFGHRGEGDFALLLEAGERLGFEVLRRETFMVDDARVSSSRVRDALAAGALEAARKLLGRAYGIRGRVVYGERRGRTIGFPTLNIPLARRTCPLHGVYAVRVTGVGALAHGGMANVGSRPTFDGKQVLLEVNLFDFDTELYGRAVHVEFLRRLREERRFESLDELGAQLRRDRDQARSVLRVAV